MFYTIGNIEEHKDHGMGLNAITPLLIKPFTRELKEHGVLWTKHGFLEAGPGTIIVFNTNQPHAWFCNGLTIFLSQEIRKISSRQKTGTV